MFFCLNSLFHKSKMSGAPSNFQPIFWLHSICCSEFQDFPSPSNQPLFWPWAYIKKSMYKSAFTHCILMHKDFGMRIRELMLNCISTERFSVLMDGAPSLLFYKTSGIHLGNPLSLPLYDIVLDCFNRNIQAKVKGE